MIEHRVLRRHFKLADPALAAVIADIGPVALRRQRDRFKTLARSIIAQQISTAAARTIRARLERLVAPNQFRPAAIAALSPEQLRGVGVSRQKAAYLRDLAQKCADGTLRLDRLTRLSDEEVIAELTQVKGIGRWSAQMFLIFSLGRPDVFPHDDLGVRAAIRAIYDLPELPNKAQSLEIGARWSPYASLGSFYCWR